VLADDRIEFLRFHFVRVQTLVLRGRVVMAGAGRGDQFDFVTHDASLNLGAFGTQVSNDYVDATLFNGAQATGRNPQAYETLLSL
jgi:hypothetical protein